jgi:hypothetical protein
MVDDVSDVLACRLLRATDGVFGRDELLVGMRLKLLSPLWTKGPEPPNFAPQRNPRDG